MSCIWTITPFFKIGITCKKRKLTSDPILHTCESSMKRISFSESSSNKEIGISWTGFSIISKFFGVFCFNNSGKNGSIAVIFVSWFFSAANDAIIVELPIPTSIIFFGLKFDELVPGRFNAKDYDKIIIGGGYLLRKSPDFFYDKFKISGKHILNSMGILGNPDDLHYLNNYRYVTVRSFGDKEKLSYLTKEVKVVPDTSMILEDLPNFKTKIKNPSIGIHLSPGFISKDKERAFAKWISGLGFNVYLLPITHYNHDFVYLRELSKKINSSNLLPILSAREIFTIIGKFDYFISCSLHGAIFSYIHNVPFVALNMEKIKFFMKDRCLQKFLFSNFEDMQPVFKKLLNDDVDYSESISEDKKKLEEHIKKLKKYLIGKDEKKISKVTPKMKNVDLIQEYNSQIHHLQTDVIRLDSKFSSISQELTASKNYISKLTKELHNKEAEISHSKDYISKLPKDLHNKEAEISKSKNSIEKLTQDLKDKATELTRSKDYISKLTKELHDKKAEITRSKDYISKLPKDLHDKEAEISKSKNSIEKLTQDLKDKATELTRSKDYISKITKELHDKEAELTKAKEFDSKLDGDISMKNDQIKNLENQLKEIEENLKIIQEKTPKYYSSRL